MKQFASDIDRSTPDPCWLAGPDFHVPPSSKSTPRTNSVRPLPLRIGAAHGAVQQRPHRQWIDARQAVQHVNDELMVADQHRHRVARQAEQPGVADAAEGHRAVQA